MTIYEKINKTVIENNLLSDANGVVIALSGGSDSMTLLDWFLHEHPCDFCAAHVNHSLREQADSDENFVKEYCERHGVVYFSKKINISGLCPSGVSLETFARDERYKFLNEIRNRTGFSHIATAHNLNDNVETLFMNIIRGCGISGLCAIPYKRDDLIVRPLIEITKEEINDHCIQNNVPFVIDKTNFESICTRNILRNDIIPLIKKLNPSMEKTPLIELAKINLSYIEQQTENILKTAFKKPNSLLLEHVSTLHDALLYEVLRRAFFIVSAKTLDFTHTKELACLIRNARTSKKTGLPYGYQARIAYNKLVFEKNSEASFTIEKTLLNNGQNEIQGLGTVIINTQGYSELFIRSRQEGDKIKYKGKTKSLKKLFIDEKIPKEDRGKYFIIEENGHIVYVHGFYCEDKDKLSVDLKKSNI